MADRPAHSPGSATLPEGCAGRRCSLALAPVEPGMDVDPATRDRRRASSGCTHSMNCLGPDGARSLPGRTAGGRPPLLREPRLQPPKPGPRRLADMRFTSRVLFPALLLPRAARRPRSRPASRVCTSKRAPPTSIRVPCFANSEVGLVGNERRSWPGGSKRGGWDGVDLSGLSVLAVVRSDATLGDPYAESRGHGVRADRGRGRERVSAFGARRVRARHGGASSLRMWPW